MRKSVILLLILVFLMASSIATPLPVKAEPKTIVVPDDYTMIQDAINSANASDTIFVRSGVYYETLVVDKSLTLVGEDREHTIIDAHKITTDVVHITGNDVTFTNFTLGHTGYIFSSGATPPSGIHLEASYNYVTNNTVVSVKGPAFQIGWKEAHDNIISNNIIINCNSFLSLFAENNTIIDNTYSEGGGGILTYGSPSVIERNEEVDYSDVPSPFPAEISLMKGNDVLEVSRTKGASFGDLVLKDNATLIVDNFDAKADSLQATDKSRIILKNGAYLYVQQISGATPMRIYLMDNASLNSTDSATVRVVCRNDTQVWARNSKLRIEASGSASVELNNCTGSVYASDKANVTITNSYCSMRGMSGEAQVWVSNSYIYSDDSSYSVDDKSKLWLVNSTYAPSDVGFKGESNVWLINSTVPGGRSFYLCDNSNLWVINSTWNRVRYLTFYNESSLWFINSNMTTNEAQDILFESVGAKIIYGWYLSVNVKSPEGTPLENMKVEIYYSNGSLVEEGITDSNGNAQFILARHIMQKDGDQYFVPYTIKAYGENLQGRTDVDLDSNKEITLTTSIYTPSPTVPTTYIVAAVIIGIVVGLALLVYFKKRNH